jgi:MFS transporter, DHA2 family, multidrug resistance protein
MLLGYAGVGHYDAHANAMGRLGYMVQAQAAVMSYIDLYWFLTVGTAIMFFLSFLLKKNDPRAGGHVVVH